jgi:hypothetical protein
MAVSRAESDLYDFVGDQLTIDPPDFRAGTFNTELGVGLTPSSRSKADSI